MCVGRRTDTKGPNRVAAETAVVCSPFRPPLRSLCRPDPREHPRIPANTAPATPSAFAGFSPVFADIRGPSENRGEGFKLALLCGFRHTCGPIAVLIPQLFPRFRRGSCGTPTGEGSAARCPGLDGSGVAMRHLATRATQAKRAQATSIKAAAIGSGHRS